MRILVVHNRYRSSSPGGEDRVVDQERQALLAAGHVVETFERSNDEIQDLSPQGRALLPFRVVRNRSSAHALRTRLSSFRPDVVHIHNLMPLLSPSLLTACRDDGVPCVTTFHNYAQVCVLGTFYRTGAECYDCVGSRLLSPSLRHGCYHDSTIATLPIAMSTVANRSLWRQVPTAYIFISDAQRRELESIGLPSDRCFVKHNFSPEPDRRATPDGTVSFLGRLVDSKGIDVLTRAWEHHTSIRPTTGLRLVIAGAGPLEDRVRTWAAGRASVVVAGHLDREAAAALVARSSTVVVPSEWKEPFGLVVAEAMAAGVAPVVSARGALPELVTDGVDGLLYPPGDHVALATLLRRVEDEPEEHAARGIAARRTYEQRFSEAVSTDRLEQIYRFAVANPRRAGGSTTGRRRSAGSRVVA